MTEVIAVLESKPVTNKYWIHSRKEGGKWVAVKNAVPFEIDGAFDLDLFIHPVYSNQFGAPRFCKACGKYCTRDWDFAENLFTVSEGRCGLKVYPLECQSLDELRTETIAFLTKQGLESARERIVVAMFTCASSPRYGGSKFIAPGGKTGVTPEDTRRYQAARLEPS